MPADFSLEHYSLHSAPVRLLEELIFVFLGQGKPRDFEDIEALASPLLKAHGVRGARIACTKVYRITANWKLALENFHECYQSVITARARSTRKCTRSYVPKRGLVGRLRTIFGL